MGGVCFKYYTIALYIFCSLGESGGGMPRQKSSLSVVQGWRVFHILCEKYYPSINRLERWNGQRNAYCFYLMVMLQSS